MGHYIFVIIGCILLTASFWIFVRRLLLLLNGVMTMGTIESFHKGEHDGSFHYWPVIIFQDQEDKAYRFTSATGSSTKKKNEGEKVRICYSRKDPNNVVIINYLDLWLTPLVLFVFGAGCVATAFGMLPLNIRLF